MKLKILMALVISLASTAYANEKQPKAFISPKAFPFQKQLFEIGIHAGQTEIKIIEIHERLLAQVEAKVGPTCLKNNERACDAAVNAMLSVFEGVAKSFETVRTRTALASTRVTDTVKFFNESDVKAYNSVIDLVNNTSNETSKSVANGNLDAIKALLMGELLLGSRTDADQNFSGKYRMTLDICRLRLSQIKAYVQANNDGYQRLILAATKLSK